MSLEALRSLSRPRPRPRHVPLSWPPPAPLPSIARLGRARSTTTTTTTPTRGRIVSMADKGEAKLSSLASVRANFALKAMDGDAVLSVDHDEIVDAGDEFRQRALVASRAQVRRPIGSHCPAGLGVSIRFGRVWGLACFFAFTRLIGSNHWASTSRIGVVIADAATLCCGVESLGVQVLLESFGFRDFRSIVIND